MLSSTGQLSVYAPRSDPIGLQWDEVGPNNPTLYGVLMTDCRYYLPDNVTTPPSPTQG